MIHVVIMLFIHYLAQRQLENISGMMVPVSEARNIGNELLSYTRRGGTVLFAIGLTAGDYINGTEDYYWTVGAYVLTGIYYTYCRKTRKRWDALNINKMNKSDGSKSF